MYLCRNLTDKSLDYIGSSLGGKDHTTVINGVKRIEEKMKVNRQLVSTIDTIKKKINP